MHCYRNSSKPRADELSTSEILHFLDYCTKNSKPGLFTVTLTGGEPFMRKDIWEILDHCYTSNINIDIATNGLLLGLSSIKKLKNYPNVNLQISVDGASSATLDPVRGEGSFKKIINLLENIQSERLFNFVDMNFVSMLNRYNYKEIFQIVELAKRYSISKVVFGECMPNGRAKDNEGKIILKPNELKETIETLTQIRKTQSEIVIVSQFYFDFLYDKEYSRANVCTAESGEVVCVGPSGDVVLCPAFSEDEEFFVGNIREDSLLKILDSKKSEMFKKLAAPDPIDCNDWEMCRGGCHILAYLETGDSRGCDPRCTKTI